jgi:cathepsin F
LVIFILELVDCDTLDEGCNGGLPENAYKFIEKMGGLETETEYPYDGRGDKCSFKSDLAKAKVTGFVEVSKNETDMQAWLLKNGPISIGINANAMQVGVLL